MPIRFAAFAALCFFCAAAQAAAPSHGRARASMHASAETPVYAPVKQRTCNDCPMPKPGFPLPRHAVVVDTWGFFNDGTDFHVLDLDTGTLVQAFVPSPTVPSRRKPKGKRTTVTLPKAAVSQLVELANRIWAEPQPIRSRRGTDTSWDLWLIDDREVRHEGGVGQPTGLAAEWIRRLNKLLGVDDASLDESPLGK